MAVSIKVTGVKEIERKIVKATRDIKRELADGMQQGGEAIEREIVKNLSGRLLKRRSGRLAGSVRTKTTVKREDIVTVISTGGPKTKYARLQEEGGQVRGNPWLTIPLPAAMTAVGQVRGRARDFKNTRIAHSKGGKLFIVQNPKIGDKKGPRRIIKGDTPLFVLKTSVSIKGKHYVRKAFNKRKNVAFKIINDKLQKLLRKL